VAERPFTCPQPNPNEPIQTHLVSEINRATGNGESSCLIPAFKYEEELNHIRYDHRTDVNLHITFFGGKVMIEHHGSHIL
jgi:hypothetical protein